jgi:hypothetical protein
MGNILSSLTYWLMAKALAAFLMGVMMTVLIVGVVTSDVGEISLSWKLHDLSEEVKNDSRE